MFILASFNHSFFYLFFFIPPTRKNHNLGTNTSLHSSSSVNGEGSTPKDPFYKILDELRSLKLWKEKQEMLLKKKKENLGARKWLRFCVHDEGKRQHADDTLIIHQDLKFM